MSSIPVGWGVEERASHFESQNQIQLKMLTANINHAFVDPKAALEVPFTSGGSSDLCESKRTTQDPESGTPLPALSTCVEVQQRPGEWLGSSMGSDGSQMDQSSHLG